MKPVFLDEDDDRDTIRKPEPDEDNDNSDSFSKSEEKGLSELVRQCMGRPLNKSEQMSNWERRPLRVEQIQYAGTETFILLDYSVKC